MSAPEDRGAELRFTPTSGTVTGWIGIAAALVVVIGVLIDGRTIVGTRLALAAGIFGLLMWCFMLRPRLVIGPAEVELRNAFSSWHVPLADVRRIAVRAITRIYTDDEHFDGVAIGRPLRSMRRGRPPNTQTIGVPGLGRTITEDTASTASRPTGYLNADAVADLVTEQVLAAADDARAAGREASAHARRSWALIELVALALLLVGLAISLLL